jgi:hypothetical protein
MKQWFDDVEGTSRLAIGKSEVLCKGRAKHAELEHIPFTDHKGNRNVLLGKLRQFLLSKVGFQGSEFSLVQIAFYDVHAAFSFLFQMKQAVVTDEHAYVPARCDPLQSDKKGQGNRVSDSWLRLSAGESRWTDK